jgi:hypothetical protein
MAGGLAIRRGVKLLLCRQYRSGIIGGSADIFPNKIYVGKNLFYDNLENAVDIKGTKDVIVSENEMHTYSPTSSSAGEAVVIHNGALNVFCIGNQVYDSEYAFISTGSTNTWFIDNVAYDVEVAVHMRGASSGGAVSNTFYNYINGIHPLYSTSSFRIENNILVMKPDSGGYDVWVEGSSVVAETTMDYNLFYNESGEQIDWNGDMQDLSSFKVSSSQCSNCLSADPQFQSASANDFQLLSTSEAISNGTESPVYAQFEALYGMDIGQNRPSDPFKWDIGAFQTSTYITPLRLSVK